jgi:hypothetical protein
MMDYRGVLRSDGRCAITLWYASVPLARLLTDVDTIARSLSGEAVMRVYSNRHESMTALPALCIARGHTCALVPYREGELREGDVRPYGIYRFDVRRA